MLTEVAKAANPIHQRAVYYSCICKLQKFIIIWAAPTPDAAKLLLRKVLSSISSQTPYDHSKQLCDIKNVLQKYLH